MHGEVFGPDDRRYPSRLIDRLGGPVLELAGRWPRRTRFVAIVGARRASRTGRDRARLLARELTEAGIVVVSGGALGIDAAAHEGALQASGPTIVVLPTPIAAPVPRYNLPLFERVVCGGGALLSEGCAPRGRGAFMSRNVIVAALSDLVVIIEGLERSGTSHTLKAARRLGVPVGAIPWSLEHPLSGAPLEALARGGFAIRSGKDVRRHMSWRTNARLPKNARGCDEPLLQMMASAAPKTAPELAAALGMPLSNLLQELSLLELERRIEALPGGRFRVRR